MAVNETAACSSNRRVKPRRSDSGAHSAKPSRIVDVMSFGAVGDGRANDTKAIRRAIATLQPGEALRFPAGKVFCHDDVLSVTTADVQLLGPGTLRATAEQSSALKIEAAGVTVDGLTLTIRNTTQRWSAPDQHKMYLGPNPGIVVRDVVIDGSAAAGLFCNGTSKFVLQRVQVNDTRADGIHMTNGSRNGVVDAPVITRSGDDAVAVVSYLQDGTPCRNIAVHSPRVRRTTGGRGLSVAGGQHITYRDIDLADSAAAGVYLACESGDFVTASTRDVRVLGGHITGANTDSSIDHGAVLVYSGRPGGAVTDVVVSGLTVTNTRSTASRQIGVVTDGTGDSVADVSFQDIRLAGSPPPYQGDAPRGSYSLSDVTAAGKTVEVPR